MEWLITEFEDGSATLSFKPSKGITVVALTSAEWLEFQQEVEMWESQ